MPAPPEWVKAFDAAMPSVEGAQRRKMFGYPCVFLHGHMVAGLHEVGLVLRLPENERQVFGTEQGGTAFEPMPGRVMREYVVAPARMAAELEELRGWLGRAFAYVGTLPAKEASTSSAGKRTGASSRRREKP